MSTENEPDEDEDFTIDWTTEENKAKLEIAKVMQSEGVPEFMAREILKKRLEEQQQPRQPDTQKTEELETRIEQQNTSILNLKKRTEILRDAMNARTEKIKEKIQELSKRTSGFDYIYSRNIVKLSDDYLDVLEKSELLEKTLTNGTREQIKKLSDEIEKKIKALDEKITVKKQKIKGYVKKISDFETKEFGEE
jgi:DNA mismatch repair ATPase MutS